MSYDVNIYVRGEFAPGELSAALQPHLSEPFTPSTGHNGRVYWGSTYDELFTCVADNSDDYDDDLHRYNLRITFYKLLFRDDAERVALLEHIWQEWLTWLSKAGAEELLLVPNLGYPFRHWALAHQGPTR